MQNYGVASPPFNYDMKILQGPASLTVRYYGTINIDNRRGDHRSSVKIKTDGRAMRALHLI